MRVLVIPSWYPSPDHPTAGIFIYQQVQALRLKGDVAVLYVRDAAEGRDPWVASNDGIPEVRVQLAMPPASKSLPGRVRAVVTNLNNRFRAYTGAGLSAYDTLAETWGRPDIIHVQAAFPAAMIARALKRRYGIPYVITEHSEEYLASSERRLVRTPGVVRWLLRPLTRDASCTIAVSRFLADRLVELGLAGDPVVIPNVVPVSEPAPLPLAAPHVITHVSVMSLAKNLDMLLEAVSRLHERRTDFVLRLIGDSEYREGLESASVSLGLEHHVEFLGQKSHTEVHQLLGESAFTVVSSTHETFSVSAAESLMCGRPVLSTFCGGPEEFVTPEVGRLIASDDVEAMADGLDWMLDHFAEFDPALVHEYARARFAPDVVAEQIMDVYKEVLACATR